MNSGSNEQTRSEQTRSIFCTSRWIRHKTENFDSKLSLYANDNCQVLYRSKEHIGHFILRMRLNKTLLYNVYVKFLFCFMLNTLTASLDPDCKTERNGSKYPQLQGPFNY